MTTSTYAASDPEVEGLNPEDYPGFAMPDDDGSAALDDNLDYQDVKLKIVQQEGYDAHDFNLFDDRASQLWRKPYVEGAVEELTSGDNRSAEQLRVAVEQMMLAAGNQNPDVRMTGSAAPRSGATVKVDAQIDNEEDVLRDMGAIRRGAFAPPKQKHPSHAPGRPRSLRPPTKPLARPQAIGSSPIAHSSQVRSPSAEVPGLLSAILLLLVTMQVMAFRRGPPESSKMSQNSSSQLGKFLHAIVRDFSHAEAGKGLSRGDHDQL